MTIYEALKAKLGREPTRDEVKADIKRILSEAASWSRSSPWPTWRVPVRTEK